LHSRGEYELRKREETLLTDDACKDCKSHGRIEEALNNMKEWEKDAKETLKHIVTAKAAWSFFVVFLTVCLAVISFLWHGQTKILDLVKEDHNQSMKVVTEIKEKVIIIDYKVQQHLEETNNKK
jgi:hypothetical protein